MNAAGAGEPAATAGDAGTARLRPPQHRVCRRAVWMWTVKAAVDGLVTGALLCLVAWVVARTRWSWVPEPVLEGIWWLPVGYGVYAAASAIVSPRWRYRVSRWEVAGDVLYTRTGRLWLRWQLVPVSRIQTVDCTQGWLERLFSLATLRVQTASHLGSTSVRGLDGDAAEELARQLAVRAGELRDDAT